MNMQALLDRSPFAHQYYSDAFATYETLVYAPGVHTALPNKSQTYSVEADNAELRHYLARLALDYEQACTRLADYVSKTRQGRRVPNPGRLPSAAGLHERSGAAAHLLRKR